MCTMLIFIPTATCGLKKNQNSVDSVNFCDLIVADFS
jgi:hypothetical protein